jgi:quinol monooxygenase YgiN
MSRITFISRMTVKPGREQDFVAACNELTTKVKANEPGVIYYEFFKLREPRRYAVLESFPSEELEHAHMNSAWLAAIGPSIVDCIDGTWEREYLDPFKA